MIRLVTFVFCWKTNQRTVACLCCTSESSCRRSTNSKLQFYVYTSGLWAIVVMHHITRAVPTLWFRAISILWGVHQCLALRSPGSGWIPYRNSDFIESFLSAEKPKQTGEFSTLARRVTCSAATFRPAAQPSVCLLVVEPLISVWGISLRSGVNSTSDLI